LIVLDRFADRQAGFFGHSGEMFFDGFERFQVHHRGIAESAQIMGDVENRRLRRAIG
jgi:hypothetical protein